MKDNEDYVSRAGYGHGATLEEADSLAHRDAYLALLQTLRDSVKEICMRIISDLFQEKTPVQMTSII